jgi:hypothetical protein
MDRGPNTIIYIGQEGVVPMWLYGENIFKEEDIGDATGFVYLIINNDNGKRYIGKKLFTKSKTYQKNKKKRRTRVGSDWLSYVGSNKVLKEDATSGADLTKIILHLCSSKGWMSYYETLEILERKALQSEQYYNEYISCRINSKHLKE